MEMNSVDRIIARLRRGDEPTYEAVRRLGSMRLGVSCRNCGGGLRQTVRVEHLTDLSGGWTIGVMNGSPRMARSRSEATSNHTGTTECEAGHRQSFAMSCWRWRGPWVGQQRGRRSE